MAILKTRNHCIYLLQTRCASIEEKGEFLPILKIRKHYVYLLQTCAASVEEKGEFLPILKIRNHCIYLLQMRCASVEEREEIFIPFENKKPLYISSTNARSAFVEDIYNGFPHLHRRGRCGKPTSILEGEISK